MLYIFSNSDKSIHHIVCTDSDIRAGIIISRIYEREQISGEPIRVQFRDDTAAATNIFAAKRHEALKATAKSNDTFEEEIRAKVAELGKPTVDIKYKEFINDIITRYRNDKRIITLKDFVYNCIDLKGCDPERLYHDVDAEICRLLTTGFKEETKAKVAKLSKPDVAPVVPYNDTDAFLYSAHVNDLVGRYYTGSCITKRINTIKEVARNNNYDVDKFVKDVVNGHKDAHTAYMNALKNK